MEERPPIHQKEIPQDVREHIELFLKAGGRIQQIPEGVSTFKETKEPFRIARKDA